MVMTKDKSEQRGTLLVEALAMLGLIAMVTPTLYKKSAERMQEIQDINIASQARTMNSVVEAMMKANITDLLTMTSSATNATIILPYDDDATCSGTIPCFNKGYSAYVPFGFNAGDIKNYKEPTIFIHNDNSSLTSYIVYPKEANIGRKRAAKIASLVGSNGGMVWDESATVSGTGDAWSLDSSMIHTLKMDTAELTENSLVVTSVEPITIDSEDSEKYLYRVPPEDGNTDAYYHNTMVTDLYMGGLAEDGMYQEHMQQYHSIYNVRKLMMNSRCTRVHISGESSLSYDCDPTVADLYIGRPTGRYLVGDSYSPGSGVNNGAAWIYGNLKALNSRFRLTNTYDDAIQRVGPDVMEFVRLAGEDESSDIDMIVFRADNGENGGSASVGLLDDFVLAREQGSSRAEFIVGSSGVGGAEGAFIHAMVDSGQNVLRLNSPDGGANDSSVTYINSGGGTVHINMGSSGVTMINEEGGRLEAGKSGEWIKAGSTGVDASLYLLSGGDGLGTGSSDMRKFYLGSSEEENHMMYADSSKVSLRSGQIRVYSDSYNNDADNVGGLSLPAYAFDTSMSSGIGATLVTSRYMDILSSTFMTNRGQYMMASSIGGEVYSRGGYTLGVAGSAWIDDDLLARRAWFDNAGMRDLHAGFSSMAQFKQYPDKAWLNVYGDETTGGVYIRNPQRNTSTATDTSSAVFWADGSSVHFKDFSGARGDIKDGIVQLGWAKDGGNGDYQSYLRAYSAGVDIVGSSASDIARVDIKTRGSSVGSSLVDIQDHALTLWGSWKDNNKDNRIDMQAKELGIWTGGKSGNTWAGNVYSSGAETAQIYANKDVLRTREIDFAVEKVEGESSQAVFKVMPNQSGNDTADANVLIDGSFHVTGNDVIHIASNDHNSAAADEHRAMFEVDPEYIQVVGKKVGAEGAEWAENRALFQVAATDVGAGSSAAHEASVYVRRGAIELEHTDTQMGTGDADSGVGYIKADRLVSGSGIKFTAINPTSSDEVTHDRGSQQYDQFMVNPAYTSVMHDIKLTSRGGARLSDVLPDYVLKGVYNVSNNCPEGTSGTTCSATGTDAWAQPYVGVLPYPICPPGYGRLATLVPVSFMMAQAGDLIQTTRGGQSAYEVQQRRQAKISSNPKELVELGYIEDLTAQVGAIYSNDSTHSIPWSSITENRIQGWYLGIEADQPTTSSAIPNDAVVPYDGSSNYWVHMADRTQTDTSLGRPIPIPLYFQQNTWLKTSLEPGGTVNSVNGWKAYMGFIYDKSVWDGKLKNERSGTTAPVKSNNTTVDGSESLDDLAGNYVWNLFPVPINTIEGHATVYCHFERDKFNGWKDDTGRDLVDQLNLLGGTSDDERTRSSDGLNDPSLKYDDPW